MNYNVWSPAGGSGVTTLTIGLAHALARDGRVLVSSHSKEKWDSLLTHQGIPLPDHSDPMQRWTVHHGPITYAIGLPNAHQYDAVITHQPPLEYAVTKVGTSIVVLPSRYTAMASYVRLQAGRPAPAAALVRTTPGDSLRLQDITNIIQHDSPIPCREWGTDPMIARAADAGLGSALVARLAPVTDWLLSVTQPTPTTEEST